MMQWAHTLRNYLGVKGDGENEETKRTEPLVIGIRDIEIDTRVRWRPRVYLLRCE